MTASRIEHLSDGVTLYLGDCREILPTLPKVVDAVVTDPPYGMAWNTDSTRFTGGNPEKQLGPGRADWGDVTGDSEPFDPTPWLEFKECMLIRLSHTNLKTY